VWGTTTITFQGETIHLGGTWPRLTMRDAIKQFAEIDYMDYPDADSAGQSGASKGGATRPPERSGASSSTGCWAISSSRA
jgi:lysyl-tRNA synthetase class II